MKLLFVDFTLPFLLKDGDYPVGGWAVELSNWLSGLAVCGHQAAVMTWPGAAQYVGRELSFELLDTYDQRRGVKYIKYLADFVPAMARATADYKPDVLIQACASIETGMSALAAQVNRVPFVYRAANDTDVARRYRTRMPRYASLAYEYGISRAAGIVSQNSYQLAEFTRWRPSALQEKIYNPYGGNIFAHDAVVGRPDRTYVAWLGVFQHQKNLPLLVQVAQHNPDILFKVGGMPAAVIDQETARAIDTLRTLNNVQMAGYIKRSQITAFLSDAICLLSTSRFEGFSNTFLEALAVGTPVVLPRRVDPDGLIEAGRLGWAVDGDEHMPEALRSFAHLDDWDFAQISGRAIDYVRGNHSPTQLAQKLTQFLEQVV